MITQHKAQNTIDTLRNDLESSIKEHIKETMAEDGTDYVSFFEYNVSQPIHIPNDDGNMASTISCVSLVAPVVVGAGGHLVFEIDSGLGDHDVLIEEISTENLIYILGEFEIING